MRTLPLLACACAARTAAAPLTEPFPFLHGLADDLGPEAPLSPDPLVRARWRAGVNASALQVYAAWPVAASGHGGVINASSLKGPNASCVGPRAEVDQWRRGEAASTPRNCRVDAAEPSRRRRGGGRVDAA